MACDFVPPGAPLDGYRLVVAPNLYLVDATDAVGIERYVENGGTLVMSFFSGIVNPCDRVHEGPYPAPFRRTLGLRVEEFWPLADGVVVGFAGSGAGLVSGAAGFAGADLSGSGTVWSEDVRLEGAEAIASFTSGELAGRPALTRHRLGAGTAWYLATRPDPAAMRRLFDHVRGEADVSPVLPGLPEGVQVRERRTADGTDRYVMLNHRAEPVTVSLPSPMREELTDTGPAESVQLPTRGVAVLVPY